MDDAKTVWCGNLADEVTEELLYELFLQVAPLQRVRIPTDREGRKSNFGFITFKHEISVPYAVQLLNGTKLFEKNLNVKPRNVGGQDKQNAQHNAIHRSISFPNDAYNQNRQTQHTRFADQGELKQQFHSYESLVHLGQHMNANYSNYQENNYDHYGDNHGHNLGNNHGNNRQQWERSSYRDKEKNRERKDYDRSRNEFERDRYKRNDYSNNRNHNKRNNDRNNQNYDRDGGRRHRRRF